MQAEHPQKKEDMQHTATLSQPTSSAKATQSGQLPASSKSPAHSPESGKTGAPKVTGKPSTPLISQTPSFNILTSQAYSNNTTHEAPQYQQHILQAHFQTILPPLGSCLDKSMILLAQFESIEKKLDHITNIVEKLASAYERHETRLTVLEQRVDHMLKHLFPDEDLSCEDMDYVSQSQKTTS